MEGHPVLSTLNAVAYRRLNRRYGPEVRSWCDALPALLLRLADRWLIEPRSLIERGSVSVVVNCNRADGQPAILKVSPDRARITAEAQALASWATPHVPDVIATDADCGALLIEAIRPGTALDESGGSPPTADLATLIDALHTQGSPRSSTPPLRARVNALFESGLANFARRPDLARAVPRPLYEQGRQAAEALAAQPPGREVALHGDLTPANVLDGGSGRGLVAVDPAPCWGDPAFDAVDLLFWRTDDRDTLIERAEELGALIDLPVERLLDWCAAFAAMVALEEAEQTTPQRSTSSRVEMLIELARVAG